jgi:type IV pilus assembly protein PilA
VGRPRDRVATGGPATRRGFTLIELMLVIAIVGVLSTLGVVGVRRYVYHAKTAEARNGVTQISTCAKISYERESMAATITQVAGSTPVVHNLCTDASTPVPASLSSVSGKKYQSAPIEWEADGSGVGKGFTCLRFSMSDPQYYQYHYVGSTGSAGTFTAIVRGDLDGDGVPSAYEMNGVVRNGAVFVSPGILEISGDE